MEEKLILGVHTGLLTLPLVHFTTRTTKLQLSELTTSSVPTALQPFRNDLSLRDPLVTSLLRTHKETRISDCSQFSTE
ncbi:uncharacterized protein LOC143842409 isoform X7 [Paroedura picta]|uniref:uncharacterized protein LOC143842409 isoform X7 n=1 Tax=Paroedura picta TaxID=143630 RepID=UPI0040579A33